MNWKQQCHEEMSYSIQIHKKLKMTADFKFHLILFPAIILTVTAVHADLLVVLLQGSHVLPGLRELSLLHALPDIPVDEGSLGAHQVELVVQSGPGLSNGCGVGEHANCPLHLGQVPSWHHGWWLVVDPHLEASGTP